MNPERFPGFVSIVSAVRPANPVARSTDDERAASVAHGWIPKGASGWCYDGYYDNIGRMLPRDECGGVSASRAARCE